MEQITSLTKSLDFPPALAIEVALNEVASLSGSPVYLDEEIAKQFDISLEYLHKLNENPIFRAQVVEHKSSVKREHNTIKIKCDLAFERYFPEVVESILSKDSSTSPADKIKMLTLLSEISGAKNNKSDAATVAESMAKVANEPRIILNFPPGFQNPMTPALEAERV